MTRVAVSIGSNIQREENIRSALTELRRRYGPLTVSSVYESAPVGMAGDNFYNLVVAFDTDEAPQTVAQTLRAVEALHRRVRGGRRFVSRTLDLDLLLYGDAVIREPGLSVPREDIITCAYVLWPLAEIAPDARHPMMGRRYADIWEGFDKAVQPLWTVSMAGLK